MNKYQRSWLDVPAGSDFPIQNLPYGIVQRKNGQVIAATRIGNSVIDLHELHLLGYFKSIPEVSDHVFTQATLNAFIALGKPVWQKVRMLLSALFDAEESALRDKPEHIAKVIVQEQEVVNLLPLQIGDYTDFYSSLEHATNVGTMFRGKDNALMPNWKHLPVGYHGRSSSIVVSGTNIHRPKGQMKPADLDRPVFGPSKAMDFELEMAFVVGQSTQLGQTVDVERAMDHIFGMMVFNDLSARDIQAWEYVPLGPFLGKNFGSVVSPWIVTMDALDAFKCAAPEQDEEVLGYLKESHRSTYDINLEVAIRPPSGIAHRVCQSNYKYLYWTMAQQLAHHTVNGCNINVGDVYASGTISGSDKSSFGSMLELTWRGAEPLALGKDGERRFLEDGDTVEITAFAEKEGVRIGFGPCVTTLLPAL